MKRALSIVLILALAACGGGGGGSAVPPSNPGSQQPKTASITLRLIMPGTAAAAQAHLRHPLYTSRDTHGIGIDFKAAPSHFTSTTPNRTPFYASAVSAGSGGCGAAQSDGSFTCSYDVPGIPAGYDDFRVSLWDSVPASGAFINAKILSTNVVTGQVVLAGQANTLSFTTLPVVDSIGLTVTPSSVAMGAASSPLLTLEAKDAAGNIITGSDAFVDKNGAPLGIQLNSGDATHAPLSNGLVFDAADGTATIQYDGAAEAAPITFTAQPMGPLNGSNFAATLSFTNGGGGVGIPGDPAITAVPGMSSNSNPAAFATGTDGNLYMSETASEHIDRICISGNNGCTVGAVTQYSADIKNGLAADHNGNLWFGNFVNNEIQVFSPSSGAIVASYTVPSGNAPFNLAQGPDGSMWFTEANNLIGRTSANGIVNEYTVYPAGGFVQTRAICAGPDGNMWFSGDNGSAYTINPTTGAIMEYTNVLTSGLAPNFSGTGFCVAGPDGNVWFAMGGTTVTRITPSGVATQFDPGGYAESITVGSDGNFWIATCGPDFQCATGKIVRMTTSGIATAFTNSVPAELLLLSNASDQNVYFASTQSLYELTP